MTSEHSCGYCEIGSYEGMIELVAPSWSSKKTICVDICIALEITSLWQAGIRTTGCCCGHGKAHGYIGVWDEDIPAMVERGYVVRPNETDPSRKDGFYPKTKLMLTSERAKPYADTLKAACHVAATNWMLSGEQVERLFKQVLEIALPEQDASDYKTVTENLNKSINTSADPLAGLQRFELNGRFDCKDDNGRYVLHSEAAAVVAAKDRVIAVLNRDLELFKEQNYGLTNEIVEWQERFEAEKTKLAQYEAQEPVGYIIKHPRFTDDFQTYELSEGDISNGYTQVPLYASPAPDADMKAKCDRYEQALDRISKMDRSHGSWETIAYDATNIAGASLKVEASNDKG